MDQDQRIPETDPNLQPSPARTPEEIAEAKRVEKMRTACSSHHVAGTHERPDQNPERVAKSQ